MEKYLNSDLSIVNESGFTYQMIVSLLTTAYYEGEG